MNRTARVEKRGGCATSRFKRRIDPAEVPDHAEDKMLATRPFRARERRGKRLQQRVDAFAAFQPARDQPRGSRPRFTAVRQVLQRERRSFVPPTWRGLGPGRFDTRFDKVDIVRSTLPFRPSLTQS